MKTVLEIYKDMLQRARELRKNKATEDVGQELYHYCAELEQTEEVNPKS